MKTSPFEAQPPAPKRLLRSVVLALVGALVVLVIFVLPAEYSIDPTGVGGVLGLTALNNPTRTLQIKDVTGGNERYREIEVPEVGEPIPLPNPAVFQGQSTCRAPPARRSFHLRVLWSQGGSTSWNRSLRPVPV